MISTPRGKNHFFQWFNKPEVIAMKFPLTECPYVSEVLITEARKSLPPDIFKQEFMAEFIDAGNDVFVGVDKVSTVGVFSQEKRVDAFIGIDTGISDDFSVLTIISPVGRVLWIETLNNRSLQDIAGRFMSIMSSFNIVGGYIEVNGVGRGMYDLIKPSYSRIKPFNTSQDNKTEMVRKLIGDIESMNIELPTVELVPALHSEFSTYTYKMSNNGKLSFSHMPGTKDDHLDSLMLANYSRVSFMERKPVTIRTSRTVRPSFGNKPR